MPALQVISSKLTPPSLSGILRREHLLNYFDSVVKPLMWVSAPGGAGKTTLVADWIETRQLSCIWLRLDGSDSSPSTFFHHLLLAIQQTFPDTAVSLENFTQAYALDPISYVLRLLDKIATENSEKNIVLVLDDYHEIDKKSAIHNMLSRVTELTKSPIRLLIISRETVPPEFITIKSLNKLRIIEWNDIKFSIDDTHRFFSTEAGCNLTKDEINSIYEQSNGWAAGIRLMASSAGHRKLTTACIADGNTPSHLLQQDLFYFFANEIMSKLDDNVKYFLSRTAMLPFFTAEMANDISGLPNCEVIIDSLSRSNLFIEVHSGQVDVFSYHPLFKEYLKNYLKEKFGQHVADDTALLAASILLENESYEESIEIYLQLKAFDKAQKIIKSTSEQLISQGRVAQLSSWFDAIPDIELRKDPELLLVYGQSLLISSTDKSCSILLKSIDSFVEAKKPDMALRAYGCYLEALAISGKDYHLLEECLHKMERLCQESSPEIESAIESIACTVLFATSFQTLNHPLQVRWKTYAERALENCSDPLLLLKRCNNMMIYYRFAGEDRKTYHLMDILKPIQQQISSVPVLKLHTQLIYAFHYGYVLGKGNEAEEICRSSIDEGIASGIRLYEFWFRYILVLTLLRDNKFSDADEQIKALLDQYTIMPPVRRADILMLCGLYALYTSDFHEAIHDLEKASAMFRNAGAHYPTHWSSIVLALAYIESGDIESGEKVLYKNCSSDWLGSAYLEYQALCVEAWLEYKKEGLPFYKLEKAFSLAIKKDFVFIPLVGKKIFTKLCHFALERNIETDYVNKIISEHQLQPSSNNPFIHLWPYEVRIFTLRKFEVVKTSQGKQSVLQLQQKPIELLKFIVANGCYNVPIDTICDALWPDADGDAGYKSLKTALYRLRKNLGSDNYIVNQNNTLSLAKVCWVDALSFWNSPEEINQANIASAVSLASCYQMPFLSEDINLSWTFIARNKTVKNHKILLDKIANYFLNNNEEDKALEYFERALEVNIAEEDCYIGIMKCYYQKGRSDRIDATYKRYCETCHTLLETDPSARVKSFFLELKDSLTPCFK